MQVKLDGFQDNKRLTGKKYICEITNVSEDGMYVTYGVPYASYKSFTSKVPKRYRCDVKNFNKIEVREKNGIFKIVNMWFEESDILSLEDAMDMFISLGGDY